MDRKTGSVMVVDNIGFDAWNLLTGISVKGLVKKLADKYSVETIACKIHPEAR